MKKTVLRVIIPILIIGAVATMLLMPKPSIKLIKSESYFSEFEVVNEKVNIKCYVTLKNTFNEDKMVELTGFFPDDVNKLLQNEALSATSLDGQQNKFVIPAKSQESFEIIFSGDFAGINQKHDRLLPVIKITIDT